MMIKSASILIILIIFDLFINGIFNMFIEIRKEYKNSKKKYEEQIQQLKSEHENKISTIIEHENTIIGLKE